MKLLLTGTVLTSVAHVDATFSFARMLNEPLSEATLMHLEDELEKAASTSEGTRQSGSPLFADLSKMINDTMAPAILTAHDAAQNQLDGFGAAFEVCGTPDVASFAVGHGVTTKAIGDKLEEHRQCRAKQGTALTDAGTCNTNLGKEETVKDAACKAVPGSDGTPPALDKDGHVGCKVTDGDYEGWLNSFDSQINQLKTQYDDAAGGCGNATKMVDDMLPKCQAANASAAANKTACDALQSAADQLGCAADPTSHANCKTYHECYEKAHDNYVNANDSIAEAQVNRTVQWRVLKRMQCLLSEEAAGATHEGIDKCREATIDTSHLDLVYPEIPEKVDCAHVIGGPRPCTPEWIVEYGDLPHNAPAAPCTPCPVRSFNEFEVPGRTCEWIKHEGKYSSGWADEKDQNKYDLATAQKKCKDHSNCKAVTCREGEGGLECTLRASSGVTNSPDGEITFVDHCTGDVNQCGDGYYKISSDLPGFGQIEGKGGGAKVKDAEECRGYCNSFGDQCMSYEYDLEHRTCNLNRKRNGYRPGVGNQMFCSRANWPRVSAPLTAAQGCGLGADWVTQGCEKVSNPDFEVLDGVFTIPSVMVWKYMNVRHDSKDLGAQVHTWDNPGNPATQWRVRFVGTDDKLPRGGALYTIESVNAPGMYMNVQYDSFDRGANVHLWNNPWSQSSQWYITPTGKEGHSGIMGYAIQSSRAIGQFANIASASHDNGAAIHLWDNPDRPETRWYFNKIEQCKDDITFNGETGFCSHWCNTPGKWGCGVASTGSGPHYTCDCTGCNSCGL